jgi:hypothetical protein
MLEALTSVGTLLSAGATFLTVLQISRQRRASFRPELTLEKVKFSGAQDPTTDSVMPLFWQVPVDSPDSPRFEEFRGIPIRNVGLGAAKNVTIVWEMSVQKAVANLNDLAQKTQIPVVVAFENGVVAFNSSEFGQYRSNWLAQLNQEIDFILPISYAKTSDIIQLPMAYQLICTAILSIGLSEGQYRPPELPMIRAHIGATDISGKGVHFDFDIQFDFISAQGPIKSFDAILRPRQVFGKTNQLPKMEKAIGETMDSILRVVTGIWR